MFTEGHADNGFGRDVINYRGGYAGGTRDKHVLHLLRGSTLHNNNQAQWLWCDSYSERTQDTFERPTSFKRSLRLRVTKTAKHICRTLSFLVRALGSSCFLSLGMLTGKALIYSTRASLSWLLRICWSSLPPKGRVRWYVIPAWRNTSKAPKKMGEGSEAKDRRQSAY